MFVVRSMSECGCMRVDRMTTVCTNTNSAIQRTYAYLHVQQPLQIYMYILFQYIFFKQGINQGHLWTVTAAAGWVYYAGGSSGRFPGYTMEEVNRKRG